MRTSAGAKANGISDDFYSSKEPNGKENKQCKKLLRLDVVMMGICILMVGMLYQHSHLMQNDSIVKDASAGWAMNLPDGSKMAVDFGTKVQTHGQNVLIFDKTLTPELIKKGSLIFLSQNMGSYAYFDHYEIYRFGIESRFLGTQKYYGTKWNVVNIPLNAVPGDELRVILVPNRLGNEAKLPVMYSAQEAEFTRFLVSKSQVSILNAPIVLILSLIILGYYGVGVYKKNASPRVFNIGLFAFLTFLWFLCRSMWLQIFVRDVEFLKVISFMAGCTMYLPVILSVLTIKEFYYRRSMQSILGLIAAYTVVKLLLFVFFQVDVYDHEVFEGIFKLVVGIGYNLILILDYRKTGAKDVKITSRISMIFLGIVLLDVILYYNFQSYLSAAIVEIGAMLCLLAFVSNALKEMITTDIARGMR